MPALGKIYKHRGNRWFIRLPDGVQVWCDKQHMTFHSREHAQYTLVAIQSEIKSGTFDPSFWAKRKKSLHSFEVYALEWLQQYERRLQRGELSPVYMQGVKRYVNSHYIPAFGEMNMLDIKGRHLVSFHLSLEKSPPTIKTIMVILKKLFRDAVDQEVIQVMPKFPKLGVVPEPRISWADEAQQDEIMLHLDPNTYFFIYFLMTHGCRPGEARALQRADIDLKRGEVTIGRAFSGTVLRPFTKSKRVRVIPLDESWKELYLQQPTNIDPQAFVFTRNGNPFSSTWAGKQWRKARAKAGHSNINLYQGTRHSFASQAVNRGVDLYSVSKFLGHSDMKVTERYAHVNTSGLRKVQRQATVTLLKKKSNP